MKVHESHKTRMSDASTFDEICTLCGATDTRGSTHLQEPCPNTDGGDPKPKTKPPEWYKNALSGARAEDFENAARLLIAYTGDDPNRPGLLDTPARVRRAWSELFSGYDRKPEDVLKVFSSEGVVYDEILLMTDVPFFSVCEHHLLTFAGVAHVGYLPNQEGKIVGLSKLARLVDVYARRLQVQERMTVQIADGLHLNKDLEPRGVGVVVEASHSCVSCRGVSKSGTTTITSCLRGAFRDQVSLKAEFLNLIAARKTK